MRSSQAELVNSVLGIWGAGLLSLGGQGRKEMLASISAVPWEVLGGLAGRAGGSGSSRAIRGGFRKPDHGIMMTPLIVRVIWILGLFTAWQGKMAHARCYRF